MADFYEQAKEGMKGKSLTKDLIKEMPEVQEHSIQAEAEQQGVYDRHGNPFSPDIHVTDQEGNPKLTPKGYAKMRRKQARESSVGGVGDKQQVDQQEQEKAAYQATGIATAQSIFFIGQAVGGEEWKPDKNEADYMSAAWARYFEAKGIRDLPPGVMVTTAVMCYVAPRLGKPNTRTRLQRAGGWLKRKFSRKRARGQDDSGNGDAEVGNDPSEPESPQFGP